MLEIRVADRSDLPRLTEIYNHYVVNTAITFDIAPLSVEARVPWFDEHTAGGRHRMLVAVEAGVVVGYAGTARFRAKAAYDTTVEATIYCAHDATGRGIGTKLYAALFDAIANEDINRIVAGITLPNDVSIALHERLGFRRVGIYSEVGRKFGRYWDVIWLERPLRL